MKSKIKNISIDLIYSISALVVLNATTQLIVYPVFSRKIGQELFGNILTLLSVVSIIASSFGSASNYARMYASAKRNTKNGDYTIFLTVVSFVAVPIGLFALKSVRLLNVSNAVFFTIFLVTSIFRYYADVEFRMKLNYKSYFIFYSLIALGYLLGLTLFFQSKEWIAVLLLGEVLASVYATFKTQLFRYETFVTSSYFKESLNAQGTLSLSNLLSNLVLNADRLLIRFCIGAMSVTVFYAATLLGKVVAMFSTPLNGVLIGYITRTKHQLTKKTYSVIVVALVFIAGILCGVCWLASVIMIQWLYPDIYELARPLFFIANGSQIFYFISNSLMVLIMRLKNESVSLVVSSVHVALFLILAIPATIWWGLPGTAAALLVINVMKFLYIVKIGFDSVGV